MHEWSHALGKTKDYAYGVSGDEKLAHDSPDKAVINADSYELYYCLAIGR